MNTSEDLYHELGLISVMLGTLKDLDHIFRIFEEI